MPIQNHIHLSMTVDDDGEQAPDMKWAITEYSQVPEVVMSLKRGLQGGLQKHVMRGPGGILQFTNLRYMIRVGGYAESTETRMGWLNAMIGQTVYLCDSFHSDDGEDHTADIRQMFMAQLGPYDKFIQDLSRFYVPVELIDDNTV